MKLLKPRGTDFIKQNSEPFHHIIPLKNMKIAFYFVLYLQAFAYFQDNDQFNLSRRKRDLISWNRMANNAFALKKGLHPTKKDRTNFLARIMKFCLKTKTCKRKIE